MRCQHVTDVEIQEYLEDMQALDFQKVAHIQTCEACQKIVHHYQNQVQELIKEPQWSLSQDFTEKVLSRIPEKRKGFLKGSAQEMILGTIGGVLAISTLFYYLKPKPLITLFKNFSMPSINWAAFLVSLKAMFSIRLENSHLLIFALITLVGIMILDRVFLLPRFTRFSRPYLKTY